MRTRSAVSRLFWGFGSTLGCVSVAALLTACASNASAPPVSEPPPPPASTAAPLAPSPAPVATAVSPAPIAVSPAVRDAVAAADRSADDRALDAGRLPAELLSFFGVGPGMRVGELAAGGGYTAELLARIVGPAGKVYGQNSRFILERFAEKPWSERLKKPIMSNVLRVDRDFDEPLPPEAKELDAVLLILFYHDTVWMKTDRDKMNRNIFAALKSGGVYGIVDHSSRDGAGVTEAETLHRIEEKVVREEIQRAGFVFDGEASLLRHADDERDWNASPRTAAERRGTSDRFVLRFKKP